MQLARLEQGAYADDVAVSGDADAVVFAAAITAISAAGCLCLSRRPMTSTPTCTVTTRKCYEIL